MPLPDKIRETLRLPVIMAPMFLASGLKLVSACCREGIIGTFPAKCANSQEIESWLIKLTENHKIMRSRTGQNIPPFELTGQYRRMLT